MSTRTLTKAKLGRCRNCSASIPRDDMGLSLCDDCLQEMVADEAPRPATHSRTIQGRRYEVWSLTDRCHCIRRDCPGGRTAQFESREALNAFVAALGEHLAELDKRQAARRESARQAVAVQIAAPKPEPNGYHYHGLEHLADLMAETRRRAAEQAKQRDYWQRWQLATPYVHTMLWWNGQAFEASIARHSSGLVAQHNGDPKAWQRYTAASVRREVARQQEALYLGWAEAIKHGAAGKPRLDFGALGAGL